MAKVLNRKTIFLNAFARKETAKECTPFDYMIELRKPLIKK
jgi:hypothetical protein